MPEIKCAHGHAVHVSTPEWIEKLTIDQMRRATELMNEKIKAAEAQPKRCVWRVCVGGWVDANYREEDYDKAADHLLRIFKERFSQEAKDFIGDHYGTIRFEREIPHISVELVSQLEYDTEWFPKEPA